MVKYVFVQLSGSFSDSEGAGVGVVMGAGTVSKEQLMVNGGSRVKMWLVIMMMIIIFTIMITIIIMEDLDTVRL